MTKAYNEFKKHIINTCVDFEFKDAEHLIFLQTELIRIYEGVEDHFIIYNEFSSDEYNTLRYSLRELITTISWALYHNYNSELYVSKTFIDLTDEYMTKMKKGE